MRKLLVAVDGSGAALRALHAAIALAKLVPDSSIHLVHALRRRASTASFRCMSRQKGCARCSANTVKPFSTAPKLS